MKVTNTNIPKPVNTNSAVSPKKSVYIPSITEDEFERRFGNRYEYEEPGNYLGYN